MLSFAEFVRIMFIVSHSFFLFFSFILFSFIFFYGIDATLSCIFAYCLTYVRHLVLKHTPVLC